MYSLRANILEPVSAVDPRERRCAECKSPVAIDISEAEFVKTFRPGRKDSVRGLIKELIPFMARLRRNDSISRILNLIFIDLLR